MLVRKAETGLKLCDMVDLGTRLSKGQFELLAKH